MNEQNVKEENMTWCKVRERAKESKRKLELSAFLFLTLFSRANRSRLFGFFAFLCRLNDLIRKAMHDVVQKRVRW